MSLALESNRSDPESRRDRDTANLSGSDDRDVGRSDRTSSGVRQVDDGEARKEDCPKTIISIPLGLAGRPWL